MNNEPAVKDLGWANSWIDYPDIVKLCREAGHQVIIRNLDPTQHGLDTEHRCDICGYVFHVDSSG